MSRDLDAEVKADLHADYVTQIEQENEEMRRILYKLYDACSQEQLYAMFTELQDRIEYYVNQ